MQAQLSLFANQAPTTIKADKRQMDLFAAPQTPKIAKIYFYRAEGLTTETGEKNFSSIEELNQWIKAEAAKKQAENDNSCDKCDFTLTWDDEETYEGCFLLYRTGYEHHTSSIQQHICRYLRISVERKQLDDTVVKNYINKYIATL